MNTYNEYMEFTETTAIYPKECELEYLSLGLASEAGEVAGKFKKIIRDKQGIIDSKDAVKIAAELGDVLWYVARLSEFIGWTMQDVIDLNVEKLTERKDNDTIQGDGDER